MLPSVTETNWKIPQRKLSQKNSATLETGDTAWNKCRGINRDGKWNGIKSPQFLDFSNLPDARNSFFNKVTVIVSTPKPNVELSSTAPNEETFIASLDNYSLSDIENETVITVKHLSKDKNKGQCAVHNAAILKLVNKVTDPKWNKAKKPLNTAVHPFTFDLRDKYRQERKQERINMVLEEEKKNRVFRANPVPKFLKTHETANSPNNNQNNNEENHPENKSERTRKTNFQDKRTKTSTEPWKKPPFVPCLARKKMEIPKVPRLHSEIRAEKRREFDRAVEQKQKKEEEIRQMVIAIKNKQEQEEIARLRKQIVHKAEPIRKYKWVDREFRNDR